jgi:Zn-dependent M16 (insulinase) family peptidase
MTKNNRMKAIEALNAAQDEYLKTLGLYYAPDERKPLIKESMERFAKHMKEIEDGEMSDERLLELVETVKQGIEDAKYPKGACSRECVRSMFRTQDLVIAHAAKNDIPREAFAALLEMTNGMMEETIATMLVLANSNEKPYEVSQKVHTALAASEQALRNLADVVRAGRIVTMKLPSVDPSKYKQFMN